MKLREMLSATGTKPGNSIRQGLLNNGECDVAFSTLAKNGETPEQLKVLLIRILKYQIKKYGDRLDWENVEFTTRRPLPAGSSSLVLLGGPEMGHHVRLERKEGKMKLIEGVLKDPATSYWLKNAIKTSLDRDIVDAINDAEHLHSLLIKSYNGR